jgi:hypothetical protein
LKIFFDAFSSITQKLHGGDTIKNEPTTVVANADPFDELKEILFLAAEYDVRLIVYIYPDNILNQEKNFHYHWEEYQTWKHGIVQAFSEVKEMTGYDTPLWDFSGYNSITEEVLPANKEYLKSSKYYENPGHLNRTASQLILNRIFGSCIGVCETPSDFGQLLTKENIEQNLKSIRTKYQEK